MRSRVPLFLPVVVCALGVAMSLAACSDGGAETGRDLTIGLVTNNPNGMRNVSGFVEGMADLGYTEGENVTYLFAGEPVTGDDLERALDEMVQAEVDLIFTAGTPTGIAAYHATRDSGIPVVFGVIADPIEAGVMTDLSRPGGNMTGVKTVQDHGRRLELLLDIAPGTERILVPFNPTDAAASGAVDQITPVASALGVELVLHEARTSDDVGRLLAGIPAEVDAIFLVPDSTVNAHLADFVAVSSTLLLPMSGPSTAQVEEGALTAFGFVHRAAGVQAASIADRVLRGADPAVLPVENTESFLAVNLATAQSIGLEISEEILLQADVIIPADPGS